MSRTRKIGKLTGFFDDGAPARQPQGTLPAPVHSTEPILIRVHDTEGPDADIEPPHPIHSSTIDPAIIDPDILDGEAQGLLSPPHQRPTKLTIKPSAQKFPANIEDIVWPNMAAQHLGYRDFPRFLAEHDMKVVVAEHVLEGRRMLKDMGYGIPSP